MNIKTNLAARSNSPCFLISTLLILFLLTPLQMKGETIDAMVDVTVDGLNYWINNKKMTASVANNTNYPGPDIIIPDHITYDGQDYPVTTISGYAFQGCSTLTGELKIPDSVTFIGMNAFDGCSGLTGELRIPDAVTSIGMWAFRRCSGFTGRLIIGSAVEEIGESAFYYCSGFTGELRIPESVTSIERSAFFGCSGFTGELRIPESVNYIG